MPLGLLIPGFSTAKAEAVRAGIPRKATSKAEDTVPETALDAMRKDLKSFGFRAAAKTGPYWKYENPGSSYVQITGTPDDAPENVGLRLSRVPFGVPQEVALNEMKFVICAASLRDYVDGVGEGIRFKEALVRPCSGLTHTAEGRAPT